MGLQGGKKKVQQEQKRINIKKNNATLEVIVPRTPKIVNINLI